MADDNGDAAWGLAKLLELSGFRAVLARSGEEAAAVAEQHALRGRCWTSACPISADTTWRGGCASTRGAAT